MDAPQAPPHPQIPLSRRVRRSLLYGAGLATPIPRTAAFLATQWWRGRSGSADWPVAPVSPAFVAQVALDELLIAAMKNPGRFPRRSEYEQAGREIREAYELYMHEGWIDDPASFHGTPPAPGDVRVRPAWWLGRGWEHVEFESAYSPRPSEPGRERWLSHTPNLTAHASMLRYRDGKQRPWVVCLHPFGTGYASLDVRTFHAAALHRELGANVILPALPLHGPRKIARLSGDGFMTYNAIDIGHGLTQSVWDVRRLLGWVRANDAEAVALYGASLGAHVGALVAGLDDDLSAVVAGVPTSNLLDVFRRHIPARLRPRADEHGLMGEEAHAIHRVVTPLSFPPVVPRDRLFIYAATGDRMATAKQAHALWKHWGEPAIEWFGGNHIAFLWSGGTARFVHDALAKSLR